MENKNPDFTFIIMILLFVVSLFLESPASLIVKMHAFIFSVDPSSTMYFLGTTYEIIAFNYLVVFILIEFVILLLILTISFVLESGSEFEVNLPLALKKDSNYMFRKLSRINVNLNKNELRRLRRIKIIVIICLFILTVARFIGTHYWVSSTDTVTTMYFLFDYELTPLVYCPIVYFILIYIYYSLTQPLYADNIRNSKSYKLAKEKRIKDEAEKAKTDKFIIANKECINRIESTRKKADEVISALQMVTTADYLSAEEKEAYLKHINESNQLYQTYLTQNTDVFFRLNLAEIKEKLNQICTAVYKDNKEIDGHKLTKLHTQFTNLTQHQYWQYTTNFEEEKSSLHNLFNELINLDKKEELEKKLANLSPIKDMKITQSKTLEELLEQADLQSVETIDFILTELKTNSNIFEKELARLEAENDVMKRFGE